MEANSDKTKNDFVEDCQKDFKRQQERLKAMSGASNKGKTMSADLMIENLLNDSFKKPKQVSVGIEKGDHFYSELPIWLQSESTAVPSMYKQLWSLVALTPELADTQKVSQLLLTSGLQVKVLGFIWSLANKTIPGQLTKQEFFIVLALISLAQGGCKFNSLDILKQIAIPAIPVLKGGLPTIPVLQTLASQSTDIPPINSFHLMSNSSMQQSVVPKNKRDNVKVETCSVKENNLCNEKLNTLHLSDSAASNLVTSGLMYGSDDKNQSVNPAMQEDIPMNKETSKNSNFPCIGSSPTAELEDDFSEFQSVTTKINEAVESIMDPREDIASDDFTEFQSANVEQSDPFQTIVVSQARELPKIPLPKSFTEKFTNLKSNVLKVSPENEKRLKVLTATESLSSLPESKISSSNKVSTSISVLGGSRGIGSRLANHSFSIKLDKENCYKHQKIKTVPAPSVQNSEDEIIFGIRPVLNQRTMTKCHLKNSNNSKSFLLKETKIQNDDTLESLPNDQHGSMFNFASTPDKENTRKIEIPMLGTFNETVLPTKKKLPNSSADLFSVQEDKYSALREIDLAFSQKNDSSEKNDEFGDFLSADISSPSSGKPGVSSLSTSTTLLESDSSETWENWNTSSQSKTKENIFVNEPKPTRGEKENAEDLFDSFTSLSLSLPEKSDYPKNSPLPSLSDEQNDPYASETSNQSKVVGNNDVLLLNDQRKINTAGLELKSDQFGSQLDTEFWDFLNSEAKPSNEITLSRQGSLPSLDLKISTVGETEQEVIWRKCLESCFSLIQEGFEKFNGIRVKSVLDEVLSASKTGHYLNSLYIVYQISKRISQNFNSTPSIQEELEKLWGRLQELCFEYNIKLTPSEDEISEGSFQCSICLKHAICNLINQGAHSYHPTCANLWINFVEGTLPFCT